MARRFIWGPVVKAKRWFRQRVMPKLRDLAWNSGLTPRWHAGLDWLQANLAPPLMKAVDTVNRGLTGFWNRLRKARVVRKIGAYAQTALASL